VEEPLKLCSPLLKYSPQDSSFFAFIPDKNHDSTQLRPQRSSSHRIDSKSAGAYTRRGQLSWLGVALRERLTRSLVKIQIRLDGFQFLGKAVKIGHGPATVIGHH
jgi:hypothetical protein